MKKLIALAVAALALTGCEYMAGITFTETGATAEWVNIGFTEAEARAVAGSITKGFLGAGQDVTEADICKALLTIDPKNKGKDLNPEVVSTKNGLVCAYTRFGSRDLKVEDGGKTYRYEITEQDIQEVKDQAEYYKRQGYPVGDGKFKVEMPAKVTEVTAGGWREISGESVTLKLGELKGGEIITASSLTAEDRTEATFWFWFKVLCGLAIVGLAGWWIWYVARKGKSQGGEDSKP